MSIYYPNGCATSDAGYTASCCPTKELARVRHVAWIKSSVPAGVDWTVAANWTTYIESGEVIIIANTRGSADGGTWAESEGFGDTATELESVTEVVTYTDQNYLLNAANYNAIAAAKNYRFAFFTATKGYMSTNAATFKPKRPINSDAKQAVYGEIEVSFTQPGLALPFLYPQSIFACFQVIG
jgi:hypothetical protein